MKVSLWNRLKKLEQETVGRKIPPLFISSYNDDEILGFQNGDNAVIRLEGETVENLKKRAIETLQKEPGAILCTAITKKWGNWPYAPDMTPDRWCQEAKDYYNSEEWRKELL